MVRIVALLINQVSKPKWLRDALDHLYIMVFVAPVELLELWTATLATLWGVWLIVPWTQTFASSPGYSVMAELAPEWVWGLTAITAGIVQGSSLVVGHCRIRRTAALALIALWAFVGSALITANWRALSTVTYPLFAVASVLVYLRIPRENLRSSRTPNQTAGPVHG
jgi:hypothetical protein